MGKRVQSRLDSALIDAAVLGDVQAASRAISDGANVNARDPEHNETALALAASCRRDNVAELLIKAGADINEPDENGGTALMRAATGKDPNILRMLLENRADVNRKDNSGETALMKAVASANSSNAQLLIGHGADLEAADEGGNTALSIAQSYGLTHLANILEGGTDAPSQ